MTGDDQVLNVSEFVVIGDRTEGQLVDSFVEQVVVMGEWVEHAACSGVNPDLFFPDRGASLVDAQRVCACCPVRVDCLEYALETGEKFGVWGGKSERERRLLRRQRIAMRRGAE